MDTALGLSVEELALAISAAGDPDNANGLLQSTFGVMSEDERRGRLMAAAASLAARSLLIVEDDKPLTLLPPLVGLIRTLMRPAFTLKYDRAEPGELTTLAYHFAQEDGAVIQHTVRQGVVHELRETDRGQLVSQGLALFAVPSAADGAMPAVRIAQAVFDDARSRAGLQPTTAQSLLEQAGLAAKHAKALAQDLRRNRYQGSVIRIEYDPEGRPSSDRGFLLLQSERRTWILPMEVVGKEAFITPHLATTAEFEKAVHELVA